MVATNYKTAREGSLERNLPLRYGEVYNGPGRLAEGNAVFSVWGGVREGPVDA
jgi:hypothetical protein